VSYISGKPISPELMDALENLPVISTCTTVYQIGFTQSSLRMHRIGQIPIQNTGIQLIKTVDNIDSISQKKEGDEKPSTESRKAKLNEVLRTKEETSAEGKVAKPDSFKTPSFPFPSANQLPLMTYPTFDTATFTKFWKAYQISCGKLWKSMKNVFQKSVDDAPNRFQK
jgi:hypothetical protein